MNLDNQSDDKFDREDNHNRWSKLHASHFVQKIVINDQIEWKIHMVVKSVENLLIQLENFGFLENWTRCEFDEIRDKPWLYVHYLFRQESNMGLCSSHFQHFPSIDPEHRYLRPSWVSF